MMRTKIALPHDDSRGFTLAEVMIASMVLTIGLLAVVGMFPVGYGQVADAGRMTLAVTGARQILEDVGALPFANLSNLNGFDTTNPDSSRERPRADGRSPLAVHAGGSGRWLHLHDRGAGPVGHRDPVRGKGDDRRMQSRRYAPVRSPH